MTDREKPIYLLKIFSGPHLGAEVNLSEGEYVIGSGQDCDIVLQDSTIANRHMVLKVSVDQLSASVIEAPFHVDQEQIEKGRTDLRSGYSVLSIGTTQLAVGPSGKDWARILLANLRMPETVKGQDGASKDLHEGGTEKMRSDGRKDKNPPPPGPEKASKNKTGIKRILKRKGRWVAAMAISVGVITMGCALYPVIKGARRTEHSALVQTADNVAEASRLLREEGYADVAATSGKLSEVRIHGYVQDNDERRKLRDRMASVPYPVQFQVTSGDELVKAVRTLLQAKGIKGNSIYLGEGQVTVEGYAPQGIVIKNLLEQIKLEVPGIQDVRADLKDFDDVRPVIIQNLESMGLGAKLRCLESQGAIVVAGNLSPAEHTKWLASRDAMQHLAAQSVEIKEKITIIPAAVPPPPFIPAAVTLNYVFSTSRISGITMMPLKYITTEDGNRYFTGSVLPSGYTVKTISTNNIVVTKKGRSFTLEREG